MRRGSYFGSLGDLTPVEILGVISTQANAAVAFLANVASTGSSTSRATIQAWQTNWNSRRQDVIDALYAQGQDVSTRVAQQIVAQGPLTVDGIWGPNTAFTTAIWISSAPPSRIADVPAWWRTNGATLAAARDRFAADYASARATPAEPPTPPPSPTPSTPSGSTPSSTTPSSTTPSGGVTRNGSYSTSSSGSSGGAVLGIAALAALGIWYGMRNVRSGLSGAYASTATPLDRLVIWVWDSRRQDWRADRLRPGSRAQAEARASDLRLQGKEVRMGDTLIGPPEGPPR